MMKHLMSSLPSGHCDFGARLTTPRQQAPVELFQVRIMFSGRLARLHEQITQQPRAGFTDAAVSFAFRRGVFHWIEAHLCRHLAGRRKTTQVSQRVHQTERGQQAHPRMRLQAQHARVTLSLFLQPHLHGHNTP